MPWLDWTLVLLSLAAVVAMGAYARRYVKGVAGFMSGDRSAGRYLLTVDHRNLDELPHAAAGSAPSRAFS
ncbi:MAG TPA: hypothetical protein VEA63_00580 [Opitutus sp.]|nr:hypothetical protein [Opitutus sp.]